MGNYDDRGMMNSFQRNYDDRGMMGCFQRIYDGRGMMGSFQRSYDNVKGEYYNVWDKSVVDLSVENDRLRRLFIQDEGRFNFIQQVDYFGLFMGKSFYFVLVVDVQDLFLMLNKEVCGGGQYREEMGQLSKGKREGSGEFGFVEGEIEGFGEDIVEFVLFEDEIDDKDVKDEKKISKIFCEKVSFSLLDYIVLI